ncbi:MAG: flavodoxin family protein [Methanoregula sp.]|nr:flavodoxin family protein [Methanoregula sp.]
MKKKVIGLLGSPLPEGNTAQLLARALAGAEAAGCSVELIPVTCLDFQSCQEMFFCRDHETCILDDDMQQIFPKFREMDSLILATPVMTMGIPGTLKSFIDRFQVFFMAKYLRKQPLVSPEKKAVRNGLFIGISGMDIPEVFVGPKLTVRAFFDIIDCQYRDELLINDMDRIKDIKTRPDLLDAAYKKGFALGASLAASGKSPEKC